MDQDVHMLGRIVLNAGDFNFSLSAAETMESIKISVVTPNGISVMRRSFFDSVRMRALMRTRPVPRSPSR